MSDGGGDVMAGEILKRQREERAVVMVYEMVDSGGR
jgi:hypothetical protein